MIKNISLKTSILVWTLSVLLYSLYVWLSDSTFSFLVISGVTNICLLPFIFKKTAPLNVDNPVNYIQFKQDNMLIGELTIPTAKIKKIGLENMEDEAYFSLPYNHIPKVGIPYFMFPQSQFNALKQHLSQNIEGVEFIT